MPYKPNERLYRSFAASNFKPVIEERSLNDGEQSYKVKGYWTVFSTEYELYPRTKYWPAEYEQIDPHALDDADMSDVIFQENHADSPLARIRNGSLQVGVDAHGAWCIADLGGCQRGRDLYESICNGLIDEMSFGFIIASDEESEGYTSFRDEEGDYHTTITRIAKVYDCSAVTFGANPTTDIEEMRKRSYLAARIEADRRKAAEAEDAKSDEAAEHDPEPEHEEMRELTKPAFTDDELDALADALERRSKEREAVEDEEKRELPDFLKDDDDDDKDDEEKRAREEQERAAKARRMRRARALSLATA